MTLLTRCPAQVYTLEKVLKLKKDQNTQASFLDEAMSVRSSMSSDEGNALICLYRRCWTTSQVYSSGLRCRRRSRCKPGRRHGRRLSFRQRWRRATLASFVCSKSSSPRSQCTQIRYTAKLNRGKFATFNRRDFVVNRVISHRSPETVLVLRAIQPFETLYVNRSSNRLTEAVTSSFSISTASSLSSSFSSRPPAVPTANEGLAAARAIVNELDAARFDPLLVKVVAKGASRAVELFVQKAEHLVSQVRFIVNTRS